MPAPGRECPRTGAGNGRPLQAWMLPWGRDEGQFWRDTRYHVSLGSGLMMAFRFTLTFLCQGWVPSGHIEPLSLPSWGRETHRPRVLPLHVGFSRKGTRTRPLGRGVPEMSSFPTHRCRSHHKPEVTREPGRGASVPSVAGSHTDATSFRHRGRFCHRGLQMRNLRPGREAPQRHRAGEAGLELQQGGPDPLPPTRAPAREGGRCPRPEVLEPPRHRH